MMVRDVMPTPQARHRRHCEHQPPARREFGPERLESALVIRNMLQHVEQHDQIVMPVLQRHVGQIAALDRHAGPLGGESARIIIGFDRVDRAELLEHGKIAAGAAADFQDAERALCGAPAFEQAGQDPAAADEPPMIAVDLRHPLIDMAFHQASSSPVSPIFSRTM